jgi:hypothetical protein
MFRFWSMAAARLCQPWHGIGLTENGRHYFGEEVQCSSVNMDSGRDCVMTEEGQLKLAATLLRFSTAVCAHSYRVLCLLGFIDNVR